MLLDRTIFRNFLDADPFASLRGICGRAGGLSVTNGRKVSEGTTDGLVANVNARVGPVAGGKSWTLVGTVAEPEFPEDNGEAIGLRSGKNGFAAKPKLGYRHGTSVNVGKLCE